MSDNDKKDKKDKKKKKMPKGMIPIPPWDTDKETPWENIPTWPKGKRVKPTPLASGGKATHGYGKAYLKGGRVK